MKKQTVAQKNANSALKMAVKRTKSKLAPKARTKTITTYPKGEYDRTLKNELCKAYGELNMAKTCKTTPAKKKKASTKKRVTKAVKPKVSAKKKTTAAPKASAKKKALGAPKKKPSRKTAAKKSPGKSKGLFAKIFG